MTTKTQATVMMEEITEWCKLTEGPDAITTHGFTTNTNEQTVELIELINSIDMDELNIKEITIIPFTPHSFHLTIQKKI